MKCANSAGRADMRAIKIERLTVPGVADGHHERLTGSVGGGQPPHARRCDEVRQLSRQGGHARDQLRLEPPRRRGRTSSAKRSMMVRKPRASCAAASKTKWLTPSAW